MSTLTICIIVFVLSMLCFAWNKFPMGITALATLIVHQRQGRSSRFQQHQQHRNCHDVRRGRRPEPYPVY